MGTCICLGRRNLNGDAVHHLSCDFAHDAFLSWMHMMPFFFGRRNIDLGRYPHYGPHCTVGSVIKYPPKHSSWKLVFCMPEDFAHDAFLSWKKKPQWRCCTEMLYIICPVTLHMMCFFLRRRKLNGDAVQRCCASSVM